jgi:zinc protease
MQVYKVRFVFAKKLSAMHFRLITLTLLAASCLSPIGGFAQTPSKANVAVVNASGVNASGVNALKVFAQVEGISEYRLSNGLRVLLAPDASKPTTTVNITYLVGSRHENYGETGMAHLLEHMVFKGTPKRGNIMQELGKRGMDFNGTTFYDRTNYFETFPANPDNLKWALEMEADRMVNSFIARKDLDTEFSVVRNEMESGENNPHMSLWQRMASTAFDWHNYGKSTIGARTDVENVKIENLQNFYRKYYQPDNAVLLVAGKFDATATLESIRQIFGAIPKPSRTLEPTYTQDPVQDGEREVIVRRTGDTQLSAVLYHTAAGSHQDAAAMAALSEVLSGTPNGRLHKSLVEKKLAVNVSPWNFDLAERGYVVFMAELSKTQNLSEARKVLLSELEGLAQKPVTEDELKRAKASLLSEIDKTINDPQKLAVQLSESIANGDWRLFFLQRDRIENLTVADLQAVGLNYFKASNRTLGQFIPTATPDRIQMPTTVDVAKLVANYKGKAATSEGEVFDISPANIEKRTQRLALQNGMKLIFTPKKTRGETVNGYFTLRFGDEKSLFNQATTSNLTASLLMRGAGALQRAEISAKLDELKTQIEVTGSGQTVTVRFDTLRKNLPEVLGVVRDLLRKPTFPQKEFDLLIEESTAALESQRSEPNAMGSQAMALALDVYPKGDVRAARSLDESIAALKAASLDQVKQFHSQYYGASNSEFALVGDFDSETVKAQLQQYFGDWQSPKTYTRLKAEPKLAKAQVIQLEAPDKANAFFLAGLPLSLQDTHPEFVPLQLANRVLGGGVKSRLLDRLRQKDGLSYGAGSQLNASSYEPSGMWVLYAIYAPQNLSKLKVGVQEELAKFVKEGITVEELADAKKSWQEERKIGRAQDRALAASHVTQTAANRTMSFVEKIDALIEATTLEEVNAAIRKTLDPSKFLNIYAGDFVNAAPK